MRLHLSYVLHNELKKLTKSATLFRASFACNNRVFLMLRALIASKQTYFYFISRKGRHTRQIRDRMVRVLGMVDRHLLEQTFIL